MPLQLPALDQIPAGVWAGMALAWIALSMAYRRKVGHPLLASERPGAVFAERWASARVGTGLVARLGTARNCIHLQVTATELSIHPHFPFTLGFMPEVYDLDHVIALANIRSAVILSGGRAKVVEISYLTPKGSDGTMQLLLRNAQAFVQAVHARGRG